MGILGPCREWTNSIRVGRLNGFWCHKATVIRYISLPMWQHSTRYRRRALHKIAYRLSCSAIVLIMAVGAVTVGSGHIAGVEAAAAPAPQSGSDQSADSSLGGVSVSGDMLRLDASGVADGAATASDADNVLGGSSIGLIDTLGHSAAPRPDADYPPISPPRMVTMTTTAPTPSFQEIEYLSVPDGPDPHSTAAGGDCSIWLSEVSAADRDWDPQVVLLFMRRESNCNPNAVSITGDWGLLQLNAVCWAGESISRMETVTDLPDDVAPVRLSCDGKPHRPLEAQWCYRAKETYFDTGSLPDSPCDHWLDPGVNIEIAYELWEDYGWKPWCFNESTNNSRACRAARSL